MSINPAVSDAATAPVNAALLHGRALSASLTVKDLEKSLTWYQNVGFTVDQKHEREGTVRAITLKAGDVRLLIGQDDGAKGWERIKGEGFALQITTDQSIDEIAARLKDLGVTLSSEPADMPWGARVFRVQDPDGFKLTISSK
jgi:uncharacterized glyoxalase superfamily protein PhnB